MVPTGSWPRMLTLSKAFIARIWRDKEGRQIELCHLFLELLSQQRERLSCGTVTISLHPANLRTLIKLCNLHLCLSSIDPCQTNDQDFRHKMHVKVPFGYWNLICKFKDMADTIPEQGCSYLHTAFLNGTCDIQTLPFASPRTLNPGLQLPVGASQPAAQYPATHCSYPRRMSSGYVLVTYLLNGSHTSRGSGTKAWSHEEQICSWCIASELFVKKFLYSTSLEINVRMRLTAVSCPHAFRSYSCIYRRNAKFSVRCSGARSLPQAWWPGGSLSHLRTTYMQARLPRARLHQDLQATRHHLTCYKWARQLARHLGSSPAWPGRSSLQRQYILLPGGTYPNINRLACSRHKHDLLSPCCSEPIPLWSITSVLPAAVVRKCLPVGFITTPLSSAPHRYTQADWTFWTGTQLVALVTGANKGIGKEIACGLASHGFQVLLCARDADLGEAAARELQAFGSVSFLPLDVCNPVLVESTAQHVRERYGRLDVLVRVPSGRFGRFGKCLECFKLSTITLSFESYSLGSLCSRNVQYIHYMSS